MKISSNSIKKVVKSNIKKVNLPDVKEAKKNALKFGGEFIAGKTENQLATRVVQYAAVESYNEGDYLKALQLYTQVPQNQRSEAVQVRIAQIFLELGDLQTAEQILNDIEVNNESIQKRVVQIRKKIDSKKHATGAGLASVKSLLKNLNFSTLGSRQAHEAHAKIFGSVELNASSSNKELDILLDELADTRRTKDVRHIVNKAEELVGKFPQSGLARYELAVALAERGQVIRALGELKRASEAGLPLNLEKRSKQLEDLLEEIEILASIETYDLVASNKLLVEEHQPERLAHRGRNALKTSGAIIEEIAWFKNPTVSLQIRFEKELFKSKRYKFLLEYLKERYEENQLDEWELTAFGASETAVNGHVSENTLNKINAIRVKNKKSKFNLNDFYSHVNSIYKAKDAFLTEDKASPNNPKWWDKGSRLAVASGDYATAASCAVMYAELTQDRHARYRAAILAEQAKQWELAIANYSLCIEGEKHKSSARLRLATLLAYQKNDHETAIRLLKPYWEKFDIENALESSINDVSDDQEEIVETVSIAETSAIDLAGMYENTQEARLEYLDKAMEILDQSNIDRSSYNKNQNWYKEKAMSSLKNGKYSEASWNYWAAAFSMNKFDAEVFYGLGYCAAVQGDLQSSIILFDMSQEVPTPFMYEVGKASPRTKKVYRYLELIERLPIRQNTWLWESYFGRRLDCNPYAMYKEAIKNHNNENSLHIWVAEAKTQLPKDILRNQYTVVTERESIGYWLALACAKYLTNNASYSFEYMHRNGQVHVNTWHGTPLKYLGHDDKESQYDYGNVGRNLVHSTHILMPNEYTANIMTRRYDVDLLVPKGSVQVTGYPRNDVLVNSPDQKKNADILRSRLGIPDDGLPVILYLPTWRGSSSEQSFDTDKLLQDLNRLGDSTKWHLLFRGHPLTQHLLNGIELPVQVPAQEISTYELMNLADLTITDYSSLGIDFLATGRPIIYYVYDWEEYSAERGLYIDKLSIPGKLVEDIDSLVDQLNYFVENKEIKDVKWQHLIDKFVPFDDGTAASRCVKTMVTSSGIIEPTNKAKKQLLIHYSFNSIVGTENIVSQLKELNNEWDVTLILDHSLVVVDTTLPEVLDNLPGDIRVIPRKGGLVANAEESQVSNILYGGGSNEINEFHKSSYRSAMQREYYRLLGNNKFDKAILFGEYSTFWTAFFALGVDAKQKILVKTAIPDEDLLPRYSLASRADQFLNEFDQVFAADASLLGKFDNVDNKIFVDRNANIFNNLRLSDDSELTLLSLGSFNSILKLEKVNEAIVSLSNELNRNIKLKLVGSGLATKNTKLKTLTHIDLVETNYPFSETDYNANALITFDNLFDQAIVSYWAANTDIPVINIANNLNNRNIDEIKQDIKEVVVMASPDSQKLSVSGYINLQEILKGSE